MTATEQQLVALIRTTLPGQPQAVALPAVADWDALIADAAAQRLAPLLYMALTQQRATLHPPPAVLAALRERYLTTFVRNGMLYAEQHRLAQAFSAASVPVVWLKGIFLAATLYEDVGSRPIGDIDFLIAPESLPAVLQMLEGELDYRPNRDLRPGFRQAFGGEECYIRQTPPPVAIEPHWHLLNFPFYQDRVPMAWFWAQTTSAGKQGASLPGFNATALFLHLAAHFCLHHRERGLLWSYDLALLLAKAGDDIDWRELSVAAQSMQLVLPVQVALAEVQTVWGSALPRTAADLLTLAPMPAERTAFRIYTAEHREAAPVWEALHLPGWRQRFDYLGRAIFPDLDYLRWRYGMTDDRLAPLYYGRRIGRGIALFSRSVAAIIWNRVRGAAGRA